MESGLSYRALRSIDRPTPSEGRLLFDCVRADGRLFAPEEDAVTARTEVEILTLPHLDAKLRRDRHVATLARSAADLDDGHAAPLGEDLLVLLADGDAQATRDRLAFPLIRAHFRAQLTGASRGVGVQRARLLLERLELGLGHVEPAVDRLALLEHREQLLLEPRVRLLVGVDLPLRGLELLLVADAAETHPPVLDLALLLLEQRL